MWKIPCGLYVLYDNLSPLILALEKHTLPCPLYLLHDIGDFIHSNQVPSGSFVSKLKRSNLVFPQKETIPKV